LVQGKGFGRHTGSIYFGENKASIKSWSENSLWVFLPFASKITNNFRIVNAA
jgi:hypothetical protein